VTWFLGEVGALFLQYFVGGRWGLRCVDEGDGGDGDVSGVDLISLI